jgi:uncharacterized protein
MLIVVSPAKNLDFKPQNLVSRYTSPEFTEQSEQLVTALRKLAPRDISRLMKVSMPIAELNFQRYMAWQPPFTADNAKPAILAFNGEVYRGLKAKTFRDEDFRYAQDHFRILSGLYGVLRPLDLIQPYRLEMGIKLETPGAANLYRFWDNRITEKLNDALTLMKNPVLVNLASFEYFKAINIKLLKARVISIEFLENKNDNYRTIVVYTKKARGMMGRFILLNRLTDPEDMKAFDEDGYIFNPRLSKENNWVFTRN